MKVLPGPYLIGISSGAVGGALLRYLLQRIGNLAFTNPYGTLIVNILGSFILGFVAGFFSTRVYSIWYYTIATGFCGSFTTFSSISLEVFEMLRMGDYARALTYVGISLISGLLAVGVGWWLGMQIR
jgi:CrcB protein